MDEWIEEAEKILAPFRLIRPEGIDTRLMVRCIAEALSDAYTDGFFDGAIDSPVNRK